MIETKADRWFWGVLFKSRNPIGDPPMLLYRTWDSRFLGGNDRLYPEEPSRPLLFRTRKQAADWCRAAMESYRSEPKGSVMRRWHVRPVRVNEVITVYG